MDINLYLHLYLSFTHFCLPLSIINNSTYANKSADIWRLEQNCHQFNERQPLKQNTRSKVVSKAIVSDAKEHPGLSKNYQAISHQTAATTTHRFSQLIKLQRKEEKNGHTDQMIQIPSPQTTTVNNFRHRPSLNPRRNASLSQILQDRRLAELKTTEELPGRSADGESCPEEEEALRSSEGIPANSSPSSLVLSPSPPDNLLPF